MRRWLLLAFPVVAVGGVLLAVVARAHDEPPVVEAAAEPTPAASPQAILVDVVGAIAHPGVVRLPAGSRVLDALLAAGGMTGDAALLALHKAAPLRDGMRIYVAKPGEAVPARAPGGAARAEPDPHPPSATPLGGLPGRRP